MATKEVTLKVVNRWMDSLEKATLLIQSPTGTILRISKINCVFEMNERQREVINKFRSVGDGLSWDEYDVISNVEEMRVLLEISKLKG